MTRVLCVLFGSLAYIIFFATFLYLIGFVANVPDLPRTVDRGPESALAPALIVNLALIALFGVQHSVMARAGFKRAWTRIVPEPIERSTYVLFASGALILLFAFWRPIPQPVWDVEQTFGVFLLWTLFMLGWMTVLVSTFLINHFELFGLAQVFRNLLGGPAEPPRLRQPFFYKLVRHPLYTGFFIAFWATPTMSWGHLLLAVGMSVYMLIAIRYEERDLVQLFGRDYEQYRSNVGMLTPRLRRRP
jgi:protein-S-isoprenylcysteine O-methyltransferase Ste14